MLNYNAIPNVITPFLGVPPKKYVLTTSYHNVSGSFVERSDNVVTTGLC